MGPCLPSHSFIPLFDRNSVNPCFTLINKILIAEQFLNQTRDDPKLVWNVKKTELDPYRSMYKWAHLIYFSINNWIFHPVKYQDLSLDSILHLIIKCKIFWWCFCFQRNKIVIMFSVQADRVRKSVTFFVLSKASGLIHRIWSFYLITAATEKLCVTPFGCAGCAPKFTLTGGQRRTLKYKSLIWAIRREASKQFWQIILFPIISLDLYTH